jgi:hypothetical protein
MFYVLRELATIDFVDGRSNSETKKSDFLFSWYFEIVQKTVRNSPAHMILEFLNILVKLPKEE